MSTDRRNAYYLGTMYGRKAWLCIAEWFMEMRGTGASPTHDEGHTRTHINDIIVPGILFQEPGRGVQGFGRCHVGFTNYTTNVARVWTIDKLYAFWTIQTDIPQVGGIYQWRSQTDIGKCKSYVSQPYSQACPLVSANYPEESVGVTAFRRFCRFQAVRMGAQRNFWGWTDYRYVRLPNGTETTVVRTARRCRGSL